MIRHIVMWRVKGESPVERADARRRIKTAFESLRGRIPGLQRLEVGLDHSGTDYACDAVLVTDFASQEALEAYAHHPEHLRVRDELAGLRTTRHQVDYVLEVSHDRT
jgi:hypothetical protein